MQITLIALLLPFVCHIGQMSHGVTLFYAGNSSSVQVQLRHVQQIQASVFVFAPIWIRADETLVTLGHWVFLSLAVTVAMWKVSLIMRSRYHGLVEPDYKSDKELDILLDRKACSAWATVDLSP